MKILNRASEWLPELQELEWQFTMPNLLTASAKLERVPNSEAPAAFGRWLSTFKAADYNLEDACQVWFCCSIPGIASQEEQNQLLLDLYNSIKK